MRLLVLQLVGILTTSKTHFSYVEYIQISIAVCVQDKEMASLCGWCNGRACHPPHRVR